MRFWLHRKLGWAVLAITLCSLPGPVSTVCACPRDMMTESQLSPSAKQGCPRCAPAAAALASSQSARAPQISRSSCCKSKVVDAHSATTPAQIEIARQDTRTSAPAVVAPAPVNHSTGNRNTRAPPSRRARDSASPPASYLSDYLRL